jgi:hypothetical protein
VARQSGIVELYEGKLYAIPCPYRLDGRVSTHADDMRGFAPQQVYVVLEGDGALLVETGLTVHQDLVLAGLDRILTRSTKVSMFPLSLGEFRSVCNLRPIVERFDVRMLYGPFQDGANWVDFRPELVPPGEPVGGGKVADIGVQVVSSAGGAVAVDEAGTRVVRALGAPLRLLPTHWLYDEATRTLFSSDAFTHVWRETEDGPWVVTEDDDTTTLEELIDYLVRTRFWWLAGANTQPLREGLAEVFDTYEIEIVAPSFGCVLKGREVVARHYALLQEALRVLGDRPSIGLAVGATTTGGRA